MRARAEELLESAHAKWAGEKREGHLHTISRPFHHCCVWQSSALSSLSHAVVGTWLVSNMKFDLEHSRQVIRRSDYGRAKQMMPPRDQKFALHDMWSQYFCVILGHLLNHLDVSSFYFSSCKLYEHIQQLSVGKTPLMLQKHVQLFEYIKQGKLGCMFAVKDSVYFNPGCSLRWLGFDPRLSLCLRLFTVFCVRNHFSVGNAAILAKLLKLMLFNLIKQ